VVEGTPFGRYRLIELLGRGGMGEVWRAFDTAIQRVVALKVLPPEFADDQMFQERFRREARAAASLDEPHVVPIYDVGEIDGRLYVTMRLIEGRDLHTLLAAGPLEPTRVAGIVEQIASALHAAHRIGLVHRDVKPSNILVAEDDFAYLIDFGIARATGEAGLTGTGNIVGTWAYLAPERLTHGQSDPRADIYALTCVLHECLTGSQPFPANSLEQQIAAHVSLPPPRPSTLRAGLPTELDTVVATGMAKNPDERYASTRELAIAARAAITQPITTPEPTTVAPADTFTAAQRWPTPTGSTPSVPTRQWSPPHTDRPDHKPPAHAPRGYRARWTAILAAAAVIVVVVTVVLVMITHDTGTGPVSATSGSAAPPTPPPNAGPFTGTYSAAFGPRTRLDGTQPEGPPQQEIWNVRSVCASTGCVATASRDSGNTTLTAALVFDEVAGTWLAVAVATGKCGNADAERWEVFSLQPRPGGTLTGEYSSTGVPGCASKRTVTFTRTTDARLDTPDDPANLPPRVTSPAQALHGRYHDTTTYTDDVPAEVDMAVRTDCLRTGDRCISYFHSANEVRPLSFANGKWTLVNELDAQCPSGGASHVMVTAEYPLPAPPQDPITVLTGHGRQEQTGDCAVKSDFDEKFVRTGD
jgi:serine/threonine-protein kinase